MVLSIIVAAAENNVIGRDNNLIWKLSADLKRFKALTTGFPIIMGRKTFDSIGRALPNRRNIIISRNPDFCAEGCEVVCGIDEALELVSGEDNVFIIGGGTMYKALWNRADFLYLTRVHTTVEGDTVIPVISGSDWEEVKREEYLSDEKNEFSCSFIDYVRIR